MFSLEHNTPTDLHGNQDEPIYIPSLMRSLERESTTANQRNLREPKPTKQRKQPAKQRKEPESKKVKQEKQPKMKLKPTKPQNTGKAVKNSATSQRGKVRTPKVKQSPNVKKSPKDSKKTGRKNVICRMTDLKQKTPNNERRANIEDETFNIQDLLSFINCRNLPTDSELKSYAIVEGVFQKPVQMYYNIPRVPPMKSTKGLSDLLRSVSQDYNKSPDEIYNLERQIISLTQTSPDVYRSLVQLPLIGEITSECDALIQFGQIGSFVHELLPGYIFSYKALFLIDILTSRLSMTLFRSSTVGYESIKNMTIKQFHYGVCSMLGIGEFFSNELLSENYKGRTLIAPEVLQRKYMFYIACHIYPHLVPKPEKSVNDFVEVVLSDIQSNEKHLASMLVLKLSLNSMKLYRKAHMEFIRILVLGVARQQDSAPLSFSTDEKFEINVKTRCTKTDIVESLSKHRITTNHIYEAILANDNLTPFRRFVLPFHSTKLTLANIDDEVSNIKLKQPTAGEVNTWEKRDCVLPATSETPMSVCASHSDSGYSEFDMFISRNKTGQNESFQTQNFSTSDGQSTLNYVQYTTNEERPTFEYTYEPINYSPEGLTVQYNQAHSAEYQTEIDQTNLTNQNYITHTGSSTNEFVAPCDSSNANEFETLQICPMSSPSNFNSQPVINHLNVS